MKPRVYLAGPISGLEYKDATDWRSAALTALQAAGINAYSPMREKQFLSQLKGAITPFTQHDHPLATSKGIMARDFNDCTTADVLLVNFLGVDRISLGTAMELAWAYDRHIPVVVVAEATNPNINHPMAREAVDFRVDTLAAGLAMVQTICLPEGESP